ncbi:hypothetical protein GCM10008024_20220 [Allgaiera indica]|uniref:Transposase DDE domain-containing protein n=1 Tax=Allgaiera indica TaxID=765699 RepID=A0AAN4ZZE9_9RHOB|nr:hypothetical protein GCM10008024_20220 [Allgaiera indica]
MLRRWASGVDGDAAIRACLSMKVLFGMALRQTTGFIESLLRLVGLDWGGGGGGRFQRPEPLPEDADRQHSLSRLQGAAAPSDRQHGDQG